jgi:5-formyltetrahydrofolate cyclo-ligase
MTLDAAELKRWRKSERERLIAARMAIAPAVLESWRQRIDGYLEHSFPGLAHCRLAFCWPIKGEYDARHIARTLRHRGALTALPVVVAPKTPLIFREWHPGVALACGALDIPYPVGSPAIAPDIVLLPMNGWDAQGYRLGYGAGFFDRTLAAMEKKPVTIGISYEFAKLDTIHPQPWDLPMDYVVTERGVYRRDPEGLAYLGEPQRGEPSALSSPVCYANEVKRD